MEMYEPSGCSTVHYGPYEGVMRADLCAVVRTGVSLTANLRYATYLLTSLLACLRALLTPT